MFPLVKGTVTRQAHVALPDGTHEEYMSRRGVGAGSLTLHAQGFDHGPNPKAAEVAKQRDGSNEVAILIETEESLEPTEAVARVEDPEYVRSWMA